MGLKLSHTFFDVLYMFYGVFALFPQNIHKHFLLRLVFESRAVGIVIIFYREVLVMPDQQRRAAAVPKDIDEVDAQRDIRVRIVGTVLDMEDESVTLDDGTGTVEVFMQSDELDELEESQRIRVLGRVLPTPDSFEIQAEVVQDLSDVDIENYNKVKKLLVLNNNKV